MIIVLLAYTVGIRCQHRGRRLGVDEEFASKDPGTYYLSVSFGYIVKGLFP